MASLVQAELNRISRWFMRDVRTGSMAFTKPELAAAVAAADNWVDSNAASFNVALPVAFRTGATTAQKTLLLMYVICRRVGFNPLDGGD